MAPLSQMVQSGGTPSPSSGGSSGGGGGGGPGGPGVVTMTPTNGSPQQQQHSAMGTVVGPGMTDGCGKVITGYAGSPLGGSHSSMLTAQQLHHHHPHHPHHPHHHHHHHNGSNSGLNTVLASNVQYEHGKYAAN